MESSPPQRGGRCHTFSRHSGRARRPRRGRAGTHPPQRRRLISL